MLVFLIRLKKEDFPCLCTSAKKFDMRPKLRPTQELGALQISTRVLTSALPLPQVCISSCGKTMLAYEMQLFGPNPSQNTDFPGHRLNAWHFLRSLNWNAVLCLMALFSPFHLVIVILLSSKPFCRPTLYFSISVKSWWAHTGNFSFHPATESEPTLEWPCDLYL